MLRGGQPQILPSEQVVPGDVVVLSAGSLILADGIVLEANDFFVNQAVLTGETFPVEKKPAAHRVGRKTGEYQAAPFDCIVVDGKVTAEN